MGGWAVYQQQPNVAQPWGLLLTQHIEGNSWQRAEGSFHPSLAGRGGYGTAHCCLFQPSQCLLAATSTAQLLWVAEPCGCKASWYGCCRVPRERSPVAGSLGSVLLLAQRLEICILNLQLSDSWGGFSGGCSFVGMH